MSKVNEELLSRVVAQLDALGPFSSDASREEKWRTPEQLAIDMGLVKPGDIDRLDQLLRRHEREGLRRLEAGLDPDRLVRRAKYPDRTTALALWGSTKHHKQPWSGLSPSRSDPSEDLPSSLVVPEGAPQIFLSHASDDAVKALCLAKALAAKGICSWRFQTHIDQDDRIADSVRTAIAEADALVALVTRTSMASLWVLTELHTSLEQQKNVSLVVDTKDTLLLRLIETVQFPNPNTEFDHSVEYDHNVVELLRQDFVQRHDHERKDRADRYSSQVHSFLVSLPFYLGNELPDGDRIWRPAIAFPSVPSQWSGFIALDSLLALRSKLRID